MEVVERGLQGIFTESHFDIRRSFLKKVIDLLSQDGLELKSYAIDSDYMDHEALKVEIEIKLRTSK